MPESIATSEELFLSRRRFLKALGLGTIAGAGFAGVANRLLRTRIDPTAPIDDFRVNHDFTVERKWTPEDTVYRFNNFYEFSLSKTAVAGMTRNFKLDPWTLSIEGLVNQPVQIGFEELLKMNLEQRVYRFRCVEAWAMTVPWLGVPLSSLLKLADPKPEARYVLLQSFFDPSQAPRQTNGNFPWPYKEGLTIDEAMNPLAFAAIGLYGKHLQPQNGAPLRIVLPWKYGFKGPKSVVRIELISFKPATFWNQLQPDEYGFYGNVNPDKSHPRWSQKSEVLIGQWGRRVPTRLYNGYGKWVADLYRGSEY